MQFFENLFRSLEREMGTRFDRVETRLNGVDARLDSVDARLDRMDVRLQRLDGSMTNGARQFARLFEWSEKQDQFQSDTIRRIEELNKRIAKLEGNGRTQ